MFRVTERTEKVIVSLLAFLVSGLIGLLVLNSVLGGFSVLALAISILLGGVIAYLAYRNEDLVRGMAKAWFSFWW